MPSKPLNKSNLVALGADALADLLLEAVKGDAARQRRVRLALAADASPSDAAADIRKRFATIRRGRGVLSWKAQRSLARELTDLIGQIETRIAPEAPDTGFDLLWALLHLAPGLHARTDDSNGTIGEVMDEAMAAIGKFSARLSAKPSSLADMVFEAVMQDDYGAFDTAVPALGDALGQDGLNRLNGRAEAVIGLPLTESDLAQYDFVDDPSRRAALARDSRDRTARRILQDVADLQGDVDAWLARYTAEQLTFHTIAPDAARRLLAAGRAEEALQVVETSLDRQTLTDAWFDTPDLDNVHFDCLEALGREEGLRSALLARFRARLCAPTLRRYLKRLPDFEDDAALDDAKTTVRAFPDLTTALGFCLTWPDGRLAAGLVQDRTAELDGDAYQTLTPLAEALVPEHPLAAVLAWRAMILFALEKARAGRYGHAARHLAACARCDTAISDYRGHPDHATFVARLRAAHARKTAFWDRVDPGE